MRAAVVGSPIAHSLSPVLHRAAYAELGVEGRYDAIEVPAGGLAELVAGLGGDWRGLSVTMPLKREALELARMRSETATITRAANTLLRLGSGWSAENTDVPGLVAALQEAGVERIEAATVLGGGATATSALVALSRLGAGQVNLVVRRPEAVEELADLADRLGVVLVVVPWDRAPAVLAAPVVVSTVPKGAADALASGIAPGSPGVLLDALYEPWPTPLALAWERAGGIVLGGLDLLVHQAVLQVELMTGRRPAVATLREAGLAALAAR